MTVVFFAQLDHKLGVSKAVSAVSVGKKSMEKYKLVVDNC